MANCRILLTPLNERDEQRGYSTQGLKRLSGTAKLNPRLGFTRTQFVQELPRQQKGMSISGYQPKLQLVLDEGEFRVVDHQGNFILKPSPADFPGLAENEHATMTLMSRLGFDVPVHGLLSFAPQSEEELEYAFVIRRYDRDNKGLPVHQEQLDGAMQITDKYGKTGNDNEQYVSYETLARFLVAHVNDNIAFKIDLFRRIVYAWLLGNNDMHLRNFGLVYSDGLTPALAPVYDFVSVAPYLEYFHSNYLALPLLTREEGGRELAPGFHSDYGEYIGQDFLLLGESMGLASRLLEKLFQDIRKENAIVMETYEQSFMTQDHIQAVLQCYRHRLGLL
ncbi:TPA: HipA domain-containing protein [Escherichia coli]|nr:HipA domain-containing protein [Escherichia coli]HBA9581055.1 HipA domain-containing protein [Escherichia coli]HBA9585937.1 HipA domain-containing protein [Escherichia coli]